jgi:hypothetical protein
MSAYFIHVTGCINGCMVSRFIGPPKWAIILSSYLTYFIGKIAAYDCSSMNILFIV